MAVNSDLAIRRKVKERDMRKGSMVFETQAACGLSQTPYKPAHSAGTTAQGIEAE
jgi:hypothetical protein